MLEKARKKNNDFSGLVGKEKPKLPLLPQTPSCVSTDTGHIPVLRDRNGRQSEGHNIFLFWIHNQK